VSGQLHSLATLLSGKNSQCPLNGSLGGPQTQYGIFGDVQNFLSQAGLKPYIVKPIA